MIIFWYINVMGFYGLLRESPRIIQSDSVSLLPDPGGLVFECTHKISLYYSVGNADMIKKITFFFIIEMQLTGGNGK